MASNNLRLNRQQLAQFLPNHEAIKAFEQLFSNVYETTPTDLESVQASADAAQLQAAEALSQLANVANALSLALYGAYQENAQQETYLPALAEQQTEEAYVPPIALEVLASLPGKESSIAAGTTAQYWRGDKTWRDFATDVRAAVLTGLSTATNAAITATDTVLSAFGKLQAQISGLGTMSSQNANSVAITGGNINGTAIGATTRSTAKVTTLDASGIVSTSISTASAQTTTQTQGGSDPNFNLGFRNGSGTTTNSEQAVLSFSYGTTDLGGIGFVRGGSANLTDITFKFNGAIVGRAVANAGLCGESGSTGMTSGFVYIPSAGGAPTGTPTAVSGRVPMYYDSTNNKFYVYNGAWKSVALI